MQMDIDTPTTTTTAVPAAASAAPPTPANEGHLFTVNPGSAPARLTRVPRSSLAPEAQSIHFRLLYPGIHSTIRQIDSDLRRLVTDQRYPVDREELRKVYDRVIRFTRFFDDLERRGFVDESVREARPYIRHLGRLKGIFAVSEMFGMDRGHSHGRRQFQQAVETLERTRLPEDRTVRPATLTTRPGGTAGTPGMGTNTGTGIGSTSGSSSSERNGRGTGSQNTAPEGDG